MDLLIIDFIIFFTKELFSIIVYINSIYLVGFLSTLIKKSINKLIISILAKSMNFVKRHVTKP